MITVIIRNRFIIAPPLLSSTIKPFDGLEYTAKFYGLVKQYLPEERDRLLKLADAGTQFVKAFGKKYFPIEKREYYGNSAISLKELTKAIPVTLHGMENWNYESIWGMPKSQLLAEVISINPLEGHRNGGNRVVILEQFYKILSPEIGRPLVKMLPLKGCDLKDIEKILKDSPYPDYLDWFQWIFHRTGNRWLDATDKEVAWSRNNVIRLARDYPQYIEIDKRMKDFNKWLEADFKKRAASIIKYISGKLGKPLIEVFAGEENDNTKKQSTSAVAL